MSAQTEDLPEVANDPQTWDIIRWIGTILWWIGWPVAFSLYYIFYYAAFAVLFLVKLVYRPIAFILAPVVYLVQFIMACLAAPFHFLAKFETIYIYLGVAALVGITGGLLLSLIYGSLHKLLGLDAEREPAGRTAKQYRKEKQKQKAKAEAPLISSGYFSPDYFSLSDASRNGNRSKNLLSQTIMEEMDSEY